MNQPPAITATQRNALYGYLRDVLSGLDDLRLAVEKDELEKADRLARSFIDYLRLLVEGLGWGDQVAHPVEFTMPTDDLRRILRKLQLEAADLYEAERPEQEAFREPWERTALIRDTCSEILASLDGAGG